MNSTLSVLATEDRRRIAVLRSTDEIDGIAHEWRGLARTDGRSSVLFQTCDWCLAWCHAYAGPGGDARPFVVAGYESGRLAFLWPLMEARSAGLRLLRGLSDPYAQYSDVLHAGSGSVDDWMERSISFVGAFGEFDGLHLRHVREDSPAFPYFCRSFRKVGDPDGAPYMDLTLFGDEQAYAARYSKVQRKRREKIRKHLERLGPLSFQLLYSDVALDRIVDAAIAAKRQWLVDRGLVSAPIQNDALAPFLKSLAGGGWGSELALVASILKAGERPVAFEVGLRYRGRHCGFITAHDAALTDSSPARLHMDLSQREALKDRQTVYDLMVPSDAHKVSWSSGAVAASDFWLGLSTLGKAYGAAYLRLLRPRLRRGYLLLPAALRRDMALLLAR
jgi:CelD/BcsL family acetyltransferase involved in cellulose biosynthesis